MQKIEAGRHEPGIEAGRHRPGAVDYIMDPDLHINGALLPWHRGYFGIGGSAGPGGDDI